MSDFFDRLTTTILILNAVTGGMFLVAWGVVMVVLAAVGVAWIWRKVSRLPSVEEMADPAYNPDLDSERVVTDALTAEADLLAGLWGDKRGGGR